MKRTCLQTNSNTDEQNLCEFHLDEISFKKRLYDLKDIQQINSFVGMKRHTNILPGSKKIQILYCLLILIITCSSCKKDSGPSFNFNLLEIVCYPDNNTYITFKIIPIGENEPLNIIWNDPSNFTGQGPFTVKSDSNILLDFEIQDFENISKRFTYELKNETRDSLKYDYRDKYIGSYICDVITKYQSSTEYHNDTLIVSKTGGFKNLTISNLHNNWGMNYNGSDDFYGYHSFVSFINDSIYFSESGPMGFYYTNTYKGGKISIK